MTLTQGDQILGRGKFHPVRALVDQKSPDHLSRTNKCSV